MFKKTKEIPTTTTTLHLQLDNEDSFNNQLIFGIDEEMVDARLSELSHLLISGYSGSGKTELIQSVLLSLMQNTSPDNLSITVIAPRKSEYYEFEKLSYFPNGVLVDAGEVSSFLGYQVHLIKERFKKFDDLSMYLDRPIKDIDDYNRHVLINRLQIRKDEQCFPIMDRQIVVFDNYSEFISLSPEIEDDLRRISSNGRVAGYHIFLSMERPSVDILDASIKANMVNRVCLGTFDEAGSQISIGVSGAEKLKRGEALIKLVNEKARKITSASYSREEKTDFVDSLIAKYPTYSYQKTNWKEQGVSEGYFEWDIEDVSLNPLDRKVKLKTTQRTLMGW